MTSVSLCYRPLGALACGLLGSDIGSYIGCDHAKTSKKGRSAGKETNEKEINGAYHNKTPPDFPKGWTSLARDSKNKDIAEFSRWLEDECDATGLHNL